MRTWRIAERRLRFRQWPNEPWAVVYDATVGDCFLVDSAAATLLNQLLQAPAGALTDGQLLAGTSGLSDDVGDDALRRLSEAGLIEECPH